MPLSTKTRYNWYKCTLKCKGKHRQNKFGSDILHVKPKLTCFAPCLSKTYQHILNQIVWETQQKKKKKDKKTLTFSVGQKW